MVPIEFVPWTITFPKWMNWKEMIGQMKPNLNWSPLEMHMDTFPSNDFAYGLQANALTNDFLHLHVFQIHSWCHMTIVQWTPLVHAQYAPWPMTFPKWSHWKQLPCPMTPFHNWNTCFWLANSMLWAIALSRWMHVQSIHSLPQRTIV